MSTSTSTTPQSVPAVQPSALPHGRFVWYDLMTTDPEAAKKFYGDIMGWGTAPFGESGYEMWTAPTGPIGGVMKLDQEKLDQGVPPHWLGSVCVRNVDESVKQAESLGGRNLFGPSDIPMVGRFAVIADPQGATIALFTPATEAPGHGGEPGLGEFSWHELATSDYRAAFDFYQAMFGWEKMSEMDMGPAGMYLMYGQHGQMYGGLYTLTPDMPMPPAWAFYAQVTDADATAEKVTALGGTILMGPMEVPGGDRVAMFTDPQGAVCAVHAKKR
jgi:uncharacterized protein